MWSACLQGGQFNPGRSRSWPWGCPRLRAWGAARPISPVLNNWPFALDSWRFKAFFLDRWRFNASSFDWRFEVFSLDNWGIACALDKVRFKAFGLSSRSFVACVLDDRLLISRPVLWRTVAIWP